MKTSTGPVKFAVLAADIALFTLRDDVLLVRLIQVDRPPHYRDVPGLPGGLLKPHETAEEAAERLVREKALINPKKIHIEQLYTFSGVKRDLRGRVVAVAYTAFVPWDDLSHDERQDAAGAQWKPVKDVKDLAYDHDEILAAALDRTRSRIHYTTLISKMMPKEFTLTDLEHAYEAIIKEDLDKRNFRKKILKLKILKALPHKRSGGRFRPARLYTFTSTKILEIEML